MTINHLPKTTLVLGEDVEAAVQGQRELNSQQAADRLNVSRPHLAKMLEEGALPFTKTGRHRRIRFSDLIAFKQRRDEESHEAMNALAQQAQELRMGYDV